MRRAEPLEPEVAAALEAIDATLAGDPVDPEHAELAELALILRDERPVLDQPAAASLDERVGAFGAQRPPRPARRPRVRPSWIAGPLAALAAIALVVVVVSSGSDPNSSMTDLSAPASGTSSVTSSASSSAASAGSSAGSVHSPNAGSTRAPAPSPSGSGKRQVVQSAQLSLSAPARKLDDVAQQVFDVVDSEHGFVSNSHVTSTGGPDASARFDLSIPVGHLQRTVSALSQLHGAHVLSRTDDTTDITGEVGGAGRRLAEARALRGSLLRQLAAATTSQAIASLKARLHDVDATIGRDAAQLNGLHRRVNYSNLTVTIQPSATPVTPVRHSHGFTLHRALHDAVRVLVVVAGVALIALAVLVPVSLLAALLAWMWLAIRRRRREAMLDLM